MTKTGKFRRIFRRFGRERPHPPPETRIKVTNLREGEALPHPLVLLEGVATSLPSTGEPLVLEVRVDAARTCAWPVATPSGRFKALALLPTPGVFELTLLLRGDGGRTVVCERSFTVSYAPPPPTRVVRFYYHRSSDGSGFDAPPGVDTSDNAALVRIRLNALLMQTATAEMLCAAGLPRRTFAVEFAADGLPLVRLLRSSFSNATARAMSDQELLRSVHNDIDAQRLDTDTLHEFKHAVILGCSSYNPVTQRADGNIALSDDKVSVFGSCGLHTWPQQLCDVTAAFLDNRKLDTRTLLDDSCSRGTHWANYATGIGAFLHELGHTFGLGHATTGIMGRGYDDMNRLFSVYEINPHGGQPGFQAPGAGDGDGCVRVNLAAVHEVEDRAGAHWNSSSARILQHCPWISDVPQHSTCAPSVSWVHDVCGPVGNSGSADQQIPFESSGVAGQNDDAQQDLGAVLVDCGNSLNRIQTFTRADVAAWDSNNWRTGGNRHLFVLTAGEHVTHVDVRAATFIDGIQIHTNRRSSRWFGGFDGVLDVLKPAHGCKIHTFFGTGGDNHVGTLGARCSPIAPGSLVDVPTAYTTNAHARPSFSPFRSPTLAGLGLGDGTQREFSSTPSLTPDIQAVAVTCDVFVESVRVLSRDDHAVAIRNQDTRTFRPHEHVFELVAGEKLVRVEVRSGHWVDCVRFTTNLRASPWFGGTGGSSIPVMDAPAGYKVCGLYGTRGNRYVGALGALFCEEQASVPSSVHETRSSTGVAQQGRARPDLFSTMYAPAVPPPSLIDAVTPASSSGHVLGILVATHRDSVAFVRSFDCTQAYNEILKRINSTGRFDKVMCFPLTRDEQLVQVDVSFRHVQVPAARRDGPWIKVVDGVCFHTSTRCSSWLGAFNSSAVRFFTAPEGSAVGGLASVFSNGVLTDIVGWHSPDAIAPRQSFVPDSHVHVEIFRGVDIRIETRSEFGLESVHLLKKNGGDHLNCYAWDWTQFHPTAPLPRRWFLPQRMLLDKISSPQDDERGSDGERPATASELLFSEYLVGALDYGGGFSKAAGPLARY